MSTVQDAVYWRAAVGTAPWVEEVRPLAAHAPAALQAAALRLHQASQAGTQVAQVPYLPAAAVGKSITLTTAQGGRIAGRISAVEHIFDGALSITRLELEGTAE